MDESGEGAAPDAEAGGGGITSFLTSVRGVVSTFAALVLAPSGLVAALRSTGGRSPSFATRTGSRAASSASESARASPS